MRTNDRHIDSGKTNEAGLRLTLCGSKEDNYFAPIAADPVVGAGCTKCVTKYDKSLWDAVAASAVVQLGQPVKVEPGDYRDFKSNTPILDNQDTVIGSFILALTGGF